MVTPVPENSTALAVTTRVLLSSMASGIATTQLRAAVRRAALSRTATSSRCPALARGYAAMKRKAVLSEKGAAPAASPPTTASANANEKAKGKTGKKANTSGKATTPATADEKPKAPLTAEEQNLQSLEEIDRIMAYQHLMPTVDPWGQPIADTLGASRLPSVLVVILW